MSSSVDLRAAARALGGTVSGHNSVTCPGPYHSSRDRSLSVRFTPDGFIVHPFSAKDDPLACKDYVRAKLGLPAWSPRGRAPVRRKTGGYAPSKTDVADTARILRATKLWDAAVDPHGTPVEPYLASRALKLPPELAGTVLRFNPRCPWKDPETEITYNIAALIAPFRSIDSDTITGVHRIRLDRPDRWPKTERKMLGCVAGAAVKFDAPKDGCLTIGEGVETCMAARQLALGPAWALGSVGAIAHFPLIPNVAQLSILAETGQPSEQAIQECGRRWHRAGRRVRIVRPDVGSDINDVLMAGSK